MSGFNLLYLSIGSGHQMAATAAGQAILRERADASVNVYDPLARIFPGYLTLANLGLGWTARYGGTMYDRSWHSGDAKLLGWFSRQAWLQRGMPEGDEQVVIATHVFPLRMALAQKERGKGAKRIYAVVTDFGLHGYWPLEGVDGYFVAHEDLAVELARRGFPAERIYCSGIPLRQDFEERGEWTAAHSGGPLRVALLVGGLNSGGYTGTRGWFEDFLGSVDLDPQEARFTAVAGSRVELFADLEKLAEQTRFELYPRGLVGDMAGLMRSHDLLLAKPGGLSMAESLACGLPLACMRPSMGQEKANVAFLAQHGLLVEACTPQQAGQVVARAAREPDWLWDLRSKARSLGKPGASKALALQVLRETG